MARLHELEAKSAGTLRFCLDLYEAQNPNVPITNVPQALVGTMRLDQWHSSHPAYFEMEFRKLGAYAGFTNSFYEKYVRVPPGVTNLAFPKELLFMNAYPLRNFDNQYGRYVIWRHGPQQHSYNWAPEGQIQEAFDTAGVAIPQPTAMPKPPRPEGSPYPEHSLGTRIELFFKDLSGDYGPGRALWFPFMLVCVGVPLVFGTAFVIYFMRRSRRE